MRLADIAFYAWEPREQRVTMSNELTAEQRVVVLAVCLAHRALGHWGNSRAQDDEAWLLAGVWLDEAEDAGAQRVAA